jgi:hypothetical protein
LLGGKQGGLTFQISLRESKNMVNPVDMNEAQNEKNNYSFLDEESLVSEPSLVFHAGENLTVG